MRCLLRSAVPAEQFKQLLLQQPHQSICRSRRELGTNLLSLLQLDLRQPFYIGVMLSIDHEGTVANYSSRPARALDFHSPTSACNMEVRNHLGAINEDEYASIQDLAVALVIRACSDASESDREQLTIRYQGIPEALQAGTEDGIRSAGPLLYASLPQVDRHLIDKAIEKAVSDLSVIGDEPDTDIDRTDLAETEDFEAANGAPHEPSQGIKGLLYYIAEQDAKRKGYQHRGIACEECGETPIRGVRWHCLNCPDFDLCSTSWSIRSGTLEILENYIQHWMPGSYRCASCDRPQSLQ
ncbi:hypothetical protein KC360_g50 [Hortaea werneckii]|nr:hypothetical protein KC360_g50 [Hortaea werneckii]